MKMKLFLAVCVLAAAGLGGACKEPEEKYPVTTVVGEWTLAGEIVAMPNPCVTRPCLPGLVLGLETGSGDYVLSLDSAWILSDGFTVGGAGYTTGDVVEITGTVSVVRLDESVEYNQLAVGTVRLVSE